MAARFKYLAIAVLFAMAPAVAVEPGISGEEVLAHLRAKAASAALELAQSSEQCEAKRAAAAIPAIDVAMLNSHGADRSAIITALAHLSKRNLGRCEGSARMELAYLLGVMSTVARHYGLELPAAAEIEGIKINLLYPSATDVEQAITYSRLDDEVRSHLERAVGEAPFPVVETISRNGLSLDR